MSEKETTKKKGFSRRKFLVRSAIGVGVIIGTGFVGQGPFRRFIAGAANTLEAAYQGDTTPNLWFEVTAENQVILHSPKVEMGQGTFTGLAQIAADEFEVDVKRIQVVHAASASGNLDGISTGGSNSISGLWIPLREMAATMREMIKTEAAALMGVAATSLSVSDGIITGNGKSMTYGEVVSQVSEWKVPDTPPLKAMKDYKFIGKPIQRVDLKDKVIGTPMFGMDASMPDMLYGAVARPATIGATFVSADTTAAEGMPGVVKIVKEKDFVGVVANTRMQAENAKDAIKVTWQTDRNWQLSDIEAMIKVGQGKPVQIQREGKPKKVLADDQEGIVKAEYTSPIGAHAQIEPNGALAYVEGDKATIMMSTQVVKITRDEIAVRLDLKPENVNMKPTYLGGGFGRRLHTPNAIQAALLSKAVGKPVKCFFNRKEEFQNDTFRPPTHHVLKAKMTEEGKIEAIYHDLSSGDVMFGAALTPAVLEKIIGADIGAWRGGMIQYSGIANYGATSWRVKLPFATSFWRSLGLLANTFAIESFMDELALSVNKNPVEFRLAHIKEDEAGKRLKAVIKAAAEKGGYTDEVQNGRAMGLAASTDANTPCAHVVEVSIENKKIKVHKVTCAIDPGLAVNPDQVRAQCEGGIIMGLSGAMFEKMTVKDGVLSPTIYGPYKMALMKDAPKEIDVIILENADAPGAVGEPPMGPIGAAIANAVYRLTGERLRDLPLTLA
ncbi:MAG: molybdopterin cofactor-binding domain-containing protein [Bacteroidota bacterium]